MNLIIETDVGHDPDDLFTICYLAAAGVKIRAIVVTPGDRDQLAIARLLSKELGLDVPIGCHKHSEKYSSGGVHYYLLESYRHSRDGYADGFGKDIIRDRMTLYPDCEWLIIGPPSNFGRYLEEGGPLPKHCTMQGGFLGYGLHPHAQHRLSQFEGKIWMPTFNMNGDRKGTVALTEANIPERRFCGKNVCHSVVFNSDVMRTFKDNYDNRAADMFCRAAREMLGRGHDKKFHDPVAAVCHLHPEIGTWVHGRVTKMESGWGTVLDENGDHILAELDRDKFWGYVRKFE